MEVKLYNYIEKKKLERLLECLYSCLELPLQALNENGQTLCGFGISTPFCDCFKKLLSVYSTPKELLSGTPRGRSTARSKISEALYFFLSCQSESSGLPLIP